jgi:hypothetical protein
MKKPMRAVSPLAEVEMETLEEGREWTRRRLERKLQWMAERQGAISPPERLQAAQREVSRDDDTHDGGGSDGPGTVRPRP